MPPPQPTSGMKNPITSGPLSPWCSVCEMHDPTGEPSAGNPHAGFGERGLETRPWEPDCGPKRKRRMSHRTLKLARQSSTLLGGRVYRLIVCAHGFVFGAMRRRDLRLAVSGLGG